MYKAGIGSDPLPKCASPRWLIGTLSTVRRAFSDCECKLVLWICSELTRSSLARHFSKRFFLTIPPRSIDPKIFSHRNINPPAKLEKYYCNSGKWIRGVLGFQIAFNRKSKQIAGKFYNRAVTGANQLHLYSLREFSQYRKDPRETFRG
jgi:hypothetical protein